MNPRGLDGGVASLPCSHNSPVNCDYHPNTHCDKISLPLLAVWSNTQSIAHGVDGRKSTLAIERTRRLVRHSEEFLGGVLCGEPAKSHCARERQPGLKSNAHVFERNHVATRVEPGNRMASHMNHLGIAGGDQTDRISTERIQLETEERRKFIRRN
jgi:hypothetical protein